MKQKTKRGLILVAGMISLLAAGCRPGGGTPVYDVVVVGGGPAGIGAALAAAETGARTALLTFIHRQKGLENVRLISSASEVGVRETYRIVGEKTITEKDYLEGLVPEDALSWSYWMVDEHNAGTSGARLVFHQPERVGTVPLGAMLPKGVGHMLVAGRAVSSDHGANSAIRVQASCMGMGQAAGVTAALAARRHCDPRDVPLDMIKKQLTGIGHLVPQQDNLQ